MTSCNDDEDDDTGRSVGSAASAADSLLRENMVAACSALLDEFRLGFFLFPDFSDNVKAS